MLSFLNFLDFSGDDFGDDLAEDVCAAGFAGSFLGRLNVVPLALEVGFVAAGLLAALDRLRGKVVLGEGSSSSSESTTVDLR